MAVRFWRRKRIFPGVTLNFSKTGISISFGVKGAKFTKTIIGKKKGDERVTVGIPGSGLYYTKTTRKRKPKNKKENKNIDT